VRWIWTVRTCCLEIMKEVIKMSVVLMLISYLGRMIILWRMAEGMMLQWKI